MRNDPDGGDDTDGNPADDTHDDDGHLVPLTPDIDLFDPVQRSAWMRANNEERLARAIQARADQDRVRDRTRGRTRNRTGPSRARDDDDNDDDDDYRDADRIVAARPGTTTVVGVRFLHAEQRALLYAARRTSVTVSDLVRRWVRVGLAGEQEQRDADEVRQARLAAADAAVERITDELRRLRELLAHSG